MKYYTSRTQNRRFWTRRILWLLVTVCFVSVATITIGLLLKSRSDLLDSLHAGETQTDAPTRANPTPQFNNASGADALSLRGDCISLSGIGGAADAVRLVRAAAAGGCNAVSLVLTNADGSLLYRSEAAEAITHTTSGGVELSALRAAAEQAAGSGLRCSAVLVPSFLRVEEAYRSAALAFDAALLREIASLGFDEVVLRGLPLTAAPTDDEITALVNGLSALRGTASGLDIGISFLPSVYLSTSSRLPLERLCMYADFLSVDLSDALSFSAPSAEETLTALCTALTDSFTAFNLRALVAPSSAEEAALIGRVFAEADITNYQAVTVPSTSET